MPGFQQFSQSQPIACAVLILSLIAVVGLALGSLRVRGIGLGTAGVLFAGIGFGHFGVAIDHQILDFVREFGLILFVFTIGLQLGPGFFASLRKEGLRLNFLAASIVLGGALIAVFAGWLLHMDGAAVLGVFSGSTTNTPSLGAAQQTLATLSTVSAERAALPALAYAVSYPIGIVGIIATLLLLRAIFHIDAEAEAEAFRTERQRGVQPLKHMNLLVENANLDGVPISQVPAQRETGVTISRIRRAGEKVVQAATSETVLHGGDTILVVGTRNNLHRFQLVVGREVEADLTKAPGDLTLQRVLVTRAEVLGKTIGELGLDQLYNVAVTRVNRAGIEMTAVADMHLQFGDRVLVVGDEESLTKVSGVLGNSLKALNETHFIPVFLGIALGVIAGVLPFHFPGLPVPIRLGLAGGPLILAIVLGRIGRVGRLVWHMPANANLAFRELGITLFLACVGLKAGAQFFAMVFSASGLIWLFAAIFVTTIPLLAAGVFARLRWKLNYMTIAGVIAGSMTDPPALAFASSISKSDTPSVAYATVYPLTMLLRIVTAQALALWICR
ncbi:MAG: putative transporter [Chthoniobacter sp.]|nr:putative transporter [Chthoniobacter sp.]